MNLTEVKEFIKICSKEDRNEIVRMINKMHSDKIANAKSQFSVGDKVTSDDPRWYYGPGTIVKINRKNIVVDCGGSRVNASATLLKHCE